ncbi:hypothetical protein PENTCL1PPCAC_24670, partial [Pristionchus entomophagus]
NRGAFKSAESAFWHADMRLISLLVTLTLLGYVSAENLTRVTTPHTSFANFSDFSNFTTLENESDSDDNVSDDSENVEDNVKPHSDEATDNNSDVSDEQNDVERELIPKVPDAIIVSHINETFGNKKTFSCPRVKTDLKTGTMVGDLSPEDISLIASMGDGVASGVGLFDKKMDVEFRGASFASGGDANMDGLVTIPNILREFSPSIAGVSHGMGDADLSKHQLSVSRKGATTRDLPKQAKELLNRLSTHYGASSEKWIMIIIAIGTEELCNTCNGPDENAIREALEVLDTSLKKAFVILLGPTHVSHQSKQKKNLLKYRCDCSRDKQPGFMEAKAENWNKVFMRIQEEYDEKMVVKNTFGLLALPQLTVTSRTPELLFHDNEPIINRRGHTYMSKWLWNRLMTGERYNLSSAVLSSDSYFCPSSGCPYFRTSMNMRRCAMLSLSDVEEKMLVRGADGEVVKVRRPKAYLYKIAIAVVVISSIAAVIAGTVIYNISKRSVRGRFDEIPEEVAPSTEPAKTPADPPVPLTRQNALNRQSTRRTLEVPSPAYGVMGSKKMSPERSESMQLLTEP